MPKDIKLSARALPLLLMIKNKKFVKVKTLGHIELINYFFNNCKIFNEAQKKIIDALRRLRQGSLYYGEKATYDFLINNEAEIKNIIKILEKFVGSKI